MGSGVSAVAKATAPLPALREGRRVRRNVCVVTQAAPRRRIVTPTTHTIGVPVPEAPAALLLLLLLLLLGRGSGAVVGIVTTAAAAPSAAAAGSPAGRKRSVVGRRAGIVVAIGVGCVVCPPISAHGDRRVISTASGIAAGAR